MTMILKGVIKRKKETNFEFESIQKGKISISNFKKKSIMESDIIIIMKK